VIGIYLSYLVPILLRVIWDRKFPRGPFNLGRAGVPVAIVAILFLSFSSIALLLPTTYTDPNEFLLPDNVTVDHSAFVSAYVSNFNWAPVVVGSVFLITNVFWFAWGNRWFKGPPLDTETKWETDALRMKAITQEVRPADSTEGWTTVGEGSEFLVSQGVDGEK
ncbi:hypothetical protein BC830DRAFT_1086618, partial [Chytriomyces sp. MP71]